MEDELLDKFLEENGGKSELLNAIPASLITINRLYDICSRVPTEGTYLVMSHYLTLANAVAAEPPPGNEIIHEGARIIHCGFEKLNEDLGKHGSEIEKFNPEEIRDFRRAIAVMCYLANRALIGMEAKSVEQALGSSMVTDKDGNKINKAGPYKWRQMRAMIIEDIYEMLEHPIEKIWDDTGYGYSVPRVIIRAMCSNLNETYLAKDNLKAGPECYRVMGMIATKFGKPNEVYDRLFPLIKYGEEVAKLVARAIEIMVNEYKLVDSVPSALGSVLEMADDDTIQKDIEKGIACIVTELCDLTPKLVATKSTDHLIRLMNVDSTSVRSAVLVGSSTVLRWLTSTNDMSVSNVIQVRRLFVDKIMVLHTTDLNALVRAKSLSLMVRLIDDKILEPTEVALCLKACVPRLLDSAVLPRKYAVALASAVIGKFPVIVKKEIDFEEDIKNHRKLLLETLAKKSLRKSHYVYGLIQEFINQIQNSVIPLPEEFKPVLEAGMNHVRETICRLVVEEKYWEACIVLFHAFDIYAGSVGLEDAGISSASTSLYIAYFKNNGKLCLNESQSSSMSEAQTSQLEASLNLSNVLGREGNSHFEYLEPEDVTAERKRLTFAQGCGAMSEMIDPIVKNMVWLLRTGSKNDKTEIIGVIGALVKCEYPVDATITGPVIQAIADIGKDAAGALLPSFWSIFIGPKDLPPLVLVTNLFKVLDSVPMDIKDLLRPIILEMAATGAINKIAMNLLWEMFMRKNNYTKQEARNAIFVLGILGRHNSDVLLCNINLLVETGLSEKAFEDMVLVRHVLESLLFTFRFEKNPDGPTKDTIRFSSENAIFERIIRLLEYGLMVRMPIQENRIAFPRVAELGVQVCYRICWEPPVVIKKILIKIPQIFFKRTPEISEIIDTEEITLRFLSIMTSLLGSNINYHEKVVMGEIMKRKALKQASKQKSGKKAPPKPMAAPSGRPKRKSRAANATAQSLASVSVRDSMLSNADTNAEMDAMIGNAGFDQEVEKIRNYIEKLLDKGVFREVKTLTLHFCQRATMIKNHRFQIILVQALAKLMCVSAATVSKLVTPFIHLWTAIDSPQVKVEILKQLTVLNVRFPNQMEECNKIIEMGLDSDIREVKMACLDCMSYLSLGDMVKVRDNIAQVAIKLCDPDPVICDMAKDFFNVCAEKDNVISNAVPEVISRLSNDQKLSQEQFQKMMKSLLSRVKKEKHVVGLVDTLIGRFKGQTQSDRLWQDTAYCLAQLPSYEKSFKIIRENMANYVDKLDDPLVYRSFAQIAEVLRKNTNKPELLLKLDDYERDIDEHHAKCVENKRIAGAAGRVEEDRVEAKSTDDESDAEDAEDESEEKSNTKAKKAETGPKKSKEGDEESDENAEKSDAEDEGDKSNAEKSETKRKSKKSKDEESDDEKSEVESEKSDAENSDEGEKPNAKKSKIETKKKSNAKGSTTEAKETKSKRSKDDSDPKTATMKKPNTRGSKTQAKKKSEESEEEDPFVDPIDNSDDSTEDEAEKPNANKSKIEAKKKSNAKGPKTATMKKPNTRGSKTQAKKSEESEEEGPSVDSFDNSDDSTEDEGEKPNAKKSKIETKKKSNAKGSTTEAKETKSKRSKDDSDPKTATMKKPNTRGSKTQAKKKSEESDEEDPFVDPIDNSDDSTEDEAEKPNANKSKIETKKKSIAKGSKTPAKKKPNTRASKTQAKKKSKADESEVDDEDPFVGPFDNTDDITTESGSD